MLIRWPAWEEECANARVLLDVLHATETIFKHIDRGTLVKAAGKSNSGKIGKSWSKSGQVSEQRWQGRHERHRSFKGPKGPSNGFHSRACLAGLDTEKRVRFERKSNIFFDGSSVQRCLERLLEIRCRARMMGGTMSLILEVVEHES